MAEQAGDVGVAGKLQRGLLTLLRIAIGWHFLYEGHAKFFSGSWTSAGYLEASRWKRFAYRLARNPFVLFVLAPLFLFLIWQRIPNPKSSGRERRSIYWTSLALLGMAAGLISLFGWKAYLVIELVVLMGAGSAGVWLFYVQHQFEGVYWERGANWEKQISTLQQ